MTRSKRITVKSLNTRINKLEKEISRLITVPLKSNLPSIPVSGPPIGVMSGPPIGVMTGPPIGVMNGSSTVPKFAPVVVTKPEEFIQPKKLPFKGPAITFNKDDITSQLAKLKKRTDQPSTEPKTFASINKIVTPEFLSNVTLKKTPEKTGSRMRSKRYRSKRARRSNRK